MKKNNKILNEEITNTVESYLIEALSGITDLYHLDITTDDEKEIFIRQFEELSDFLSTWGLSEDNRIKIKNNLLHNSINNQYEKIVMLKKVRDGKKNRSQLGDNVVDNIEYALINALSELCKLYRQSEGDRKQKKNYLQLYGELFVFLSGWGVYYNLDWQDELPEDVMSEFNDEAYKRHQSFERKKDIEIIQKKWQENKIYALSGFLFQNSEFFEFDIIALSANEKFIFNSVEKIYPSHKDKWLEVSTQKSLILDNEKGKVVVGLGGLNFDGFIALVSNSNELIWSIYSEHTGAFIDIAYEDNEIILESTRGYSYIISLDNPLELKRLENKILLHHRKSFQNPLVSKEAIMKKIQKMWDWGRVYNLSGLLFGDGKFFPFDIGRLGVNEKFLPHKQMIISPLTNQWSHKFSNRHYILDEDKGKIVVSLSTHISEGFIAFVSNSNELIWSIASKYTGAFTDVEYTDNEIVVKSKCGYDYLIPLYNPLDIKRLES